MIQANDPSINYKELVRAGYNECAQKYAQTRSIKPPAELKYITDYIPHGSRILDIGCGSGIPISQSLSANYKVTGVDISSTMIELAKKNVPSGQFMCKDIMEADFPDSYFSAIVSFYTIFHIPRRQHKKLFTKMHKWLDHKGMILNTVASNDEGPGYIEDDFFDTKMFWSNYGIDFYRDRIKELGFIMQKEGIIGHGYSDKLLPAEAHPYICAIKE
jgi:SAM-dependent methyltransferase